MVIIVLPDLNEIVDDLVIAVFLLLLLNLFIGLENKGNKELDHDETHCKEEAVEIENA